MTITSSFQSSVALLKGLVLILLFIPSSSDAQHTITVQSGYAQPSGDLANLDHPSITNYSEPTIGFGAEYSYRVNDLFVVQASGSYQDFSVDQKQVVESFRGVFQFAGEPEGSTLTTVMAGPAIRLSEGHFQAQIGVQAGYMRLAGMSFSMSNRDRTISYGPETSSVVGYKAGLDLTYTITPRFGLTLSNNVTYGQFDKGVDYDISYNVVDLNQIAGPKNVTAIQTMLGLSYSFKDLK